MLRLNVCKRLSWSLIAALTLTAAFVSAYGAAATAEDGLQRQIKTDPPQPPIRSKNRYHPAHLRLRALIYDQHEGLRPKEEINRAELIPALHAASSIIDDEALWTERAAEESINYGWYLYWDIQYGFTFALALAPTKEEEREWMLRKQALTVRLMHFLLETRRRHPGYFRSAWKDGTPFAALITHLESTRDAMNLRGVLMPDEWAIYYRLSWAIEPGAVILRDGVVFVDVSLPRRLMASQPYFDLSDTGPRPKVRKAQIPIGAPAQAGPRRGFRDATGRIYIPVEELQRQGELDVRVNRSAQLVQIDRYLGPPQSAPGSEPKE